MTNSERSPIPILTSVESVSRGRSAWLCDVWGVLHDGETAFPSALRACAKFREQGGQVILISNSPRPSPGVLPHLASLGVSRNCFDDLVTSGDVTREAVKAHSSEPVYHLGPERDKALFEGLPVQFVDASRATVVVCTGLIDDEHETPEDYHPLLSALAARSAIMICA